MSNAPRVLCVGIDSGEQDLIRRWARSGVLPTFRSLLDCRTWGAVENPRGPLTGAVWASFATGVSPARHGRYWYRQLRPGTYSVYPLQFSDIKARPFWESLCRAGRRVAIVDVPDTALGEFVNGIHIANWGTHSFDASGFQTSPSPLARDVEARFGRDPVGRCDQRARRGAGELNALRADLLARVRTKLALSRYVLEQDRWDLFLTVFTEAHCAGHQFWHLHDATHPRYDEQLARSLGDPIKDVYVAIDAALGELLAHVTPDTQVLVLCSHGMEAAYGANFLLDEVLRRVENAPPRRRARDAFLWGWQRTPAALRALLRPVRTALVQRIDEAPAALDSWRKYFQIPTNDGCGGIRLNVVGREPRGLIHPGEEYDAVCDALSRDLMRLSIAHSGGPVVRRVWRVDELFQGPQRDCLPDLLVEWHRGAPIVGVDSEKTGRIDGVAPEPRTGDHTANGLFFARGPSLPPRAMEKAVSIMDFAPTIAALLDVPLPGVDGRPL